ncbi:LysR family transcriptional regulator [Paenibacillus sp. IB182496]|uniref:LysR family transcriptional regulator n=1 Tax=Paenibacillus sabuli TaxID=2772509 RepID=A0A927GPW6_9BACL|nr:LysR family transcriptional regulator [Paenibacillus sabuli]MBD2843753.1 LysR family transcriptional regulator [Paenibacillus sabuli]
MNLEQIKTFLTVYRSGSFQKAAELLFIPQPTVSHRIHQLEKQVGKPLIIRRKSGNLLTTEGKAFYPYALQLLEVLEQGQIAIDKAAKHEEVRLEIGCTNSLSNPFLYDILQGFTSHFPHMHIKVHSFSTTEIIHAIRMGTFNIGLSRYAIDDTELSFRMLDSEHVTFIVSRKHPWAGKRSVTLEEVAQHPLIVYQEGKQYRETIEFVFNQRNLVYQVKYEMHNLELIKQMVGGSHVATLFAPSYMGNELAGGQLVAIPIQGRPFPMRQTFLVYNKAKLTAADKLFHDHVLTMKMPG